MFGDRGEGRARHRLFREPRTPLSIDIAGRFGDNLTRLRKAADLSQEELSVRASLHRTEISQLERGLRLARVDTLVKIAASLEVSADELLAGLDWTPGGTVYGKFRLSEEDGP
ncbi:MAG: helix-turn-helix domain-containing protein [Solirubrobacterales bacterium]